MKIKKYLNEDKKQLSPDELLKQWSVINKDIIHFSKNVKKTNKTLIKFTIGTILNEWNMLKKQLENLKD